MIFTGSCEGEPDLGCDSKLSRKRKNCQANSHLAGMEKRLGQVAKALSGLGAVDYPMRIERR